MSAREKRDSQVPSPADDRHPTGEELRQWWLDRYSMEEIRHLAAGLDVIRDSDRDYAAWEFDSASFE